MFAKNTHDGNLTKAGIFRNSISVTKLDNSQQCHHRHCERSEAIQENVTIKKIIK